MGTDDDNKMETNGDAVDSDFTSRHYQDELLSIAIQENTILYLPTGSGKTFIATMLIKAFSSEIEKPFSSGGKRSFFLVNTVALVGQQGAAIQRHTCFNVGQYSGDLNIDLWTRERWLEELEDNSVIVMTAQILLNMLQHSYIKLTNIKVIVFDECHRAVKDHPMRNIMRYFENVPVEDQPRILGLTGSLLNATIKVDQVTSYIREIETTFLSRIITAKDDEMAEQISSFSTDPREELVEYCSENPEGMPFYMLCKSEFEELKSFVRNVLLIEEYQRPVRPNPTCIEIVDDNKLNKKLCNMIDDILFQMLDLGMYGGFKATLAHIIQLERLKRTASSAVLASVYQTLITSFTLIRKNFADTIKDYSTQDAVLAFSSRKVISFINLLKGVKPEDTVIVFVERRFTCKVLYYILQDLKKANYLPNVSSDFIVGYNNNPFNDTREGVFEKKINKDVLRKFNSGETNVLIASDVLEEGIDVQSCNLVIKYNPPKTARSYIQSKGRARNRESKYYIFVDTLNPKFSKNTYLQYRELEDCLKSELVGKFINREKPTQEELSNTIFHHAVEPFYPEGPDGPMLAGAAAISLINRYCTSLIVDYFTKLTPYWWKESREVMGRKTITVRLQLPNSSPVRETISGGQFPNLDLAKRSAAIKACRVLYECKELDSHLLPRGRSSEQMEDSEMFPNWDDEGDVKKSENDDPDGKSNEDDTQYIPGTKKRKQLYMKKYPDCLCSCRPSQGITTYMHVIHVKPNYPRPSDSRRKGAFFDILKTDNTYAILSSKPMPKVAEFPLFMSTGEVRISITRNAATLKLTKKQINDIIDFHSLVFTDIVLTVQSFMYRDFENLEQSYLFAPVKPVSNNNADMEFELDWDIIINNKSLPAIEPLTEEERINIKVNDETYFRQVVVPWYRGFAPRQAYIVTGVSEDENAHAPFPSDEFDDYVEYFTNKYSSKVTKVYSPDEMLIEVRAISNRLNCLKPRGASKGTSKRRRKEEEEFEETLVAELCVKYSVPGVYWLKATLLPSISHRLTHLLLAEELREEIFNIMKKDFYRHSSISLSSEPEVLRVLEVDHMSMQEQDEQLVVPPGSTAKTITIKPKSTLPISEPVYPWGDEQEPIDFQRNIDDVKLIDIYFYDDFISKPLSPPKVIDVTDKPLTTLSAKKNKKTYLVLNEPAPPLLILQNFKKADLSHNVQQSDVLQALTAASAHDVFSLERLETLGDSFLKYSVSLILYLSFPKLTEGQLTNIKGKIIGNRNLYYCGKKLNLGSIIKVTEFNTECDWVTPGFCIDRKLQQVMRTVTVDPRFLYSFNLTKEEQIKGKLSQDTLDQIEVKLLESQEENDTGNATFLSQQVVPDKSIADCVEALLGLYIKNCGLEMGFHLLRLLGVTKRKLINADIYKQGPVPSSRLTHIGNIEFHLHQANILEQLIGYKFKDRSFLLQALSHPTYQPNNITPTYQRLEFLGDAILDLLITSHIFETCSSKLMPGELTDLRSALVNNITLATISVRIGLHKFLLMRSCKLSEVIDNFVARQEDREHQIDDQVLFLIEEKNISLAEAVEVPKVLGDVFESIVAAIFLDSGKCLQTTWNFIYKFMKEEIRIFSASVPKNHIRQLYEENVQVKFRKSQVLEEYGRVMVPVMILYNGEWKTFHGFGETKSQAKRAAAKLALRHIRS